MIYRTLGRTGMRVSALALGTVELGVDYGIRVPGHYGRPPLEDAIALVHAALDAGINFIDTARAYGESERVLGQALHDRRDAVVLATKARPVQVSQDTELRKTLLADLETSLRELQTDWIDLWQIHNLDEALLAQVDELSALFDEVRRTGKVRWIGASTYGTTLPKQAIQTGLFDVLQITYSVLDQRLADDVFALAQAQKVGLVVRSVLLQGVLTERGDYLPAHLEILRQRSQAFRTLVAKSALALTPAQIAIAFGIAPDAISAVLLGVRTQVELRENLEALHTQLPSALTEQLYTLRLDDDALLNPATWNLE